MTGAGDDDATAADGPAPAPLTRESIRDGLLQRLVGQRDPGARPMTAGERAASIDAMLQARPADADAIRVFGYGSLLWNPAFHYAESRAGTIHGHHRRFCLWTPVGRGTADRPGLVLGLDSGGACRGLAFRVPDDRIAVELDIVWRREMVTHAYVPTWVRVHTDDAVLPAITFVINHQHPRYAGALSEGETAEVLATAGGELGSCRDYLSSTVAHLDAMGMPDSALHRLARKVAERGPA